MPDSIHTIGTVSVGNALDLTLRSDGTVLVTVLTPYDADGVMFEVHSVFKMKLKDVNEAIGELNKLYSTAFETVYVADFEGERNGVQG